MRIYITVALLIYAVVGSTPPTLAQEATDNYTQTVLEKMSSFYMSGIDEKLYLQLDKPYYSAGEQIWFKGYLRNAITHAPLNLSNFIYVELVSKDDKLISRVKAKRDDSGFSGYMALDPTLEGGHYTLRGYTQWMLNQDNEFIFSRHIEIISPIPPASEGETKVKEERERNRDRGAKSTPQQSFDMQLFAEGGALLANISQPIAFKAIGEDGLSVEVVGAIYNSKGEEIAPIATSYLGMGSTMLHAQLGEQYHALVSCDGDNYHRFELPEVEEYGAVVHSVTRSDKILFEIYSTDQSIVKDAHIIIHSRGQIVSISEAKSSRVTSMTMDKLHDGINVISLVDGNGHTLSERLVFKRPQAGTTINIEPDRENYSSRERAKVKLQLLDSDGKAARGEFGVSVTDNSSVKEDKTQDNILSYMLLSSDIYGYIEHPALYFDEQSPKMDYNIDLLMRTQGWRRFSLEGVLAGEIEGKRVGYEDVVEISGSVKGFFGNDARRPNIHVFSSSQNYFDTFILDQSSTFKLVGLDIPDSTIYIIHAKGRKGGNALTLNIEDEVFASPKSTLSPREIPTEPYVPVAFVNQSQDKFFYEGGMNLIDIDAVYVTTSSREINNTNQFSTRATQREQLEMMTGRSIPSIIQAYPNMMVSSDGVFFRGNNSPARFIVDGTDMEYSDIEYLTADDLERIDFYNGADAAMFSNAAGGVFVLEMRQGITTRDDIGYSNTVHVARLGYQPTKRFYQPKYEVKAQRDTLPPDHRTTIFWDGTLSPDPQGNIEFEFFTADRATSYTVKVEGIGDDGEIYRAEQSIERSLSH